MKSVTVTIKGLSPLLMHAFPMVQEPNLDKKTMEEQAEYSAYRNPDTKELYIPAVCLQRALVNAASYSKGKGRSSLVKQAAACILVSPERLGLGVSNFQIDSRPVVIAATKGRIIRHRPRLDAWKVTAEIEYDETLVTE